MREIKFRAWDNESKRFTNYALLDDKAMFFEKHLGTWKPSTNRFTLMQYTGLKDKNGKEIYEGDILLSTASENEEDYKKWRVSYFDGGYIANYKHIPMDKRKRSINEIELLCNDNIAFYGFEILGNIYENPELMEVDE